MIAPAKYLGSGLPWPDSIQTAVEYLRKRFNWAGKGISDWCRSLERNTGLHINKSTAYKWVVQGYSVGYASYREALKQYFGWGPQELTPAGQSWVLFTSHRARRSIARRREWNDAFCIWAFRLAQRVGLEVYNEPNWAFAYAVNKTRDGGVLNPALARKWKARYARALRRRKHRNQFTADFLADEVGKELLA